MKTKLTALFFIIYCSLFITQNVAAFPQNSLIPGGVAIIAVSSIKQAKPTVRYQSKSVALVKGSTNWLAIIGISLDAKIGVHQVDITEAASNKTKSKSFRVKKHNYRTQHLTIKNKNKVNPNKKSTKRIEREFFLKKKLKKQYSYTTPHVNFIKPTKGRDSGRFGLRRVLNKQKRNPHSGMDIAAPSGRSVKAVESGKVIFTGDLFFTGNVVYLDHGNGLISLYAHLSKINVKNGQHVKRGEIIGKVGKTGRVTGAHLHWSVYLNGNAINPALFLPKRK